MLINTKQQQQLQQHTLRKQNKAHLRLKNKKNKRKQEKGETCAQTVCTRVVEKGEGEVRWRRGGEGNRKSGVCVRISAQNGRLRHSRSQKRARRFFFFVCVCVGETIVQASRRTGTENIKKKKTTSGKKALPDACITGANTCRMFSFVSSLLPYPCLAQTTCPKQKSKKKRQHMSIYTKNASCRCTNSFNTHTHTHTQKVEL
jgi:hypothetical protein